jgi:cytochrome c oxidase subunit 3
MTQTLQHSGRPPVIGNIGGGGDGDSGRPSGSQRRASITGVVVLLAAVVMLFAAFTSAMIVRRGLGDDWKSTPVPPVLWVNTAIILASSLALELARRALRRGDRKGFNLWWTSGLALGSLFLIGQYVAWTQLQAQGVFLSSNPSSAFFYLLTATHGIHLFGGVIALGYIDYQALRLRLGPGKRTAVDVAGIYWHFMGGLWVYLLLLFRLWG